MDTVVVDSNAIADKDWHLRYAPWRVLLDRAAAGSTRLVVPEVVVREVVGAYRRSLKKAWKAATSDLNDLRGLGIEIEVSDVDLQQRSVAYEEALRARLRPARMPQPTAEILDLADRAISRHAPFNEHGGGFRDAVIWHHVLDELCGPDLGPVTLISKDSAFGRSGLKQELVAEAGAISMQPRLVRLRQDVGDYIKTIGIHDPHLLMAVVDSVSERHGEVAEGFLEKARGMRFRLAERPGEITIQELHEPSLEVVEVTKIERSALTVIELRITADADVYVELWDEPDGYVTGSATLTFEATASFDPAGSTFGNWSVEEPAFDVDTFVYWNLADRGW